MKKLHIANKYSNDKQILLRIKIKRKKIASIKYQKQKRYNVCITKKKQSMHEI